MGNPGFRIDTLCGISSVVYFCSRIGEGWADVKLLSRHGRDCNVIGNMRKHSRCLLLVSNVEEVRDLGKEIHGAEEEGILKNVRIAYGYQLSYPEEETGWTDTEGIQKLEKKGLYVLFLKSEGAEDVVVTPGLPDEAFLRGKAPMTKEEVRALSLCKLRLTRHAVLYDIGAGTGSISLESALLCEDGKVFAIEFKDDAVELLKQNKEKFCTENLEIVQAKAPEGLMDLPAPTHAFIGGSSGNMKEIIELLLEKNPKVRIVINCIALETISDIQKALKELDIKDADIVQIAASRAEALGRYHLLKAQNPIFIVSFGG